jgi:hypothetical protein
MISTLTAVPAATQVVPDRILSALADYREARHASAVRDQRLDQANRPSTESRAANDAAREQLQRVVADDAEMSELVTQYRRTLEAATALRSARFATVNTTEFDAAYAAFNGPAGAILPVEEHRQAWESSAVARTACRAADEAVRQWAGAEYRRIMQPWEAVAEVVLAIDVTW